MDRGFSAASAMFPTQHPRLGWRAISEQAMQSTQEAPTMEQPAEPAQPARDFDLDSHEWYLNRELTWLSYNRRVLAQADDPRIPLLERVKFLAIASSNLDEFSMKRIGGLKQQLAAGLQEVTVDGRTPAQQIDECPVPKDAREPPFPENGNLFPK